MLVSSPTSSNLSFTTFLILSLYFIISFFFFILCFFRWARYSAQSALNRSNYEIVRAMDQNTRQDQVGKLKAKVKVEVELRVEPSCIKWVSARNSERKKKWECSVTGKFNMKVTENGWVLAYALTVSVYILERKQEKDTKEKWNERKKSKHDKRSFWQNNGYEKRNEEYESKSMRVGGVKNK